MASRRIELKSTGFRHIKQLFLVSIRDLPRQPCFQVRFEKLTKPSPCQHELHIHAMHRGALFTAWSLARTSLELLQIATESSLEHRTCPQPRPISNCRLWGGEIIATMEKS